VNPIYLFRLVLAGLVSLGVLSQFPAPDASFEASEAIYEVPARVPSTTLAPRKGPEPAAAARPLVGFIDNCEDGLELALRAGWPAEHLAHLGRIMWRESNCKSWAFNPNDVSGGSRGLLQINGAHTKPTAWNPTGWLQSQYIGIVKTDDLFNAELNLRAGWVLYQYAERVYGDGWQPWAATRDRD